MGKFFNRTHRNLASMMLLAFLIACGGDSSTNSDDKEPNITVPLPNGEQIEFVWIEPGSFMMGSPESERPGSVSDDETQHRVKLKNGFYLGKYEVTQSQWKAVMGTRPWAEYVPSRAERPAVWVSWKDAQAFVDNLNANIGKYIYRLPTEAEWEYAARAGTTTRWSFGDQQSRLPRYALYKYGNYPKEFAQSVGGREPNPWGLYDMHGNVYEWCQDWYGPYATSAQVDPQGPSTGSYRVIRSGGFNAYARMVRSAARSYVRPGYRAGHLGFRLLRTE